MIPKFQTFTFEEGGFIYDVQKGNEQVKTRYNRSHHIDVTNTFQTKTNIADSWP